MLLKMKRHEFDLLTTDGLSKGCSELLIKIYKNRMAQENIHIPETKEHFYEQLTEGQQALFMFYVYYNHVSKSYTEFYWWSAYFLAQPKSWSAIKNSLAFFNDEPMLLLLDTIKLELKRHHCPLTIDSFTITREELDANKELHAFFKSHHVLLEKISSQTIRKINRYIENNLDEFVEINQDKH
jgi:hypothetical protein